MKARLKSNKKGDSNLFVDGHFLKGGTEIEVTETFYNANKDQFEDAVVTQEVDKRVAAELKKRDDVAAAAAKK
jgi:hypothetical protein